MSNRTLGNLREIAELWNKLEGRAKETEHFRSALDVACINEMRYAGRRMADVILAVEGGDTFDSQRVEEDIVMAKNYLYNADHDLTDATVFFAHKRFSRAIEFHGFKKVVTHFPDYEHFAGQIEEANKVIQGTRKDRMQRKAEYERLAADYVPKLRDMYNRLSNIDALRVPDTVPEKIGILDRNVTLLAWFNVIVGGLSILALGIGIWGLVIGYVTDHKADTLLEMHPVVIESNPTPAAKG